MKRMVLLLAGMMGLAAARAQDRALEEFLRSPEFGRISASEPLSGSRPDAARSFVEYDPSAPDVPIIHVVFTSGAVTRAVVDAVPLKSADLLPHGDRYVMAIVDYRDYTDKSSGEIRLYDGNYDGHLFTSLQVTSGTLTGWTHHPLTADLSARYGGLKTRPLPCDKGKDGNLSFTECFRCLNEQCRDRAGCFYLCQVLDRYRGYCSTTMAAACVVLSAWY